jgi:hypothetical protein
MLGVREQYGSGGPDLDAPQRDPRWGLDQLKLGDGVPEGPAITGSVFGVYTSGDKTGIMLEGSSQVNYRTCALEIYGREDTDLGELDKGTTFCLRTSAGRYARLIVMEDATATKVLLDVTVWEKH